MFISGPYLSVCSCSSSIIVGGLTELSNLVVSILGVALQESLDIGIELGL
jgi:hypothetical protein